MEQTTLTPKKKDKHVIDSVFVICLMLLFVLCALSVIAIGASIYQKNVSAMASNNSHRIASAYITEKVRQSDINGTVRVKELFGENVLAMSKEVNGELYTTYIYDYDGQLMELMARDSLEVVYPQSGQKIMDIKSLEIEEVSDRMFSIEVVLEDGTEDFLYITKRSTEGN
ncbi:MULTISPECIES: DUF4860 domain-containing protein [unclassified Butyrivibrio]|jgi:hypothetical protein|uniref:DUF4860 domain-containing protein n=1 Tax=unclassified Butyrivibrio TaxID=2639466 RepID=UPI0003B64E14|nr:MULTISPECIES: DUF4860 domain-containing protein [unclassified Butyrivibrio]